MVRTCGARTPRTSPRACALAQLCFERAAAGPTPPVRHAPPLSVSGVKLVRRTRDLSRTPRRTEPSATKYVCYQSFQLPPPPPGPGLLLLQVARARAAGASWAGAPEPEARAAWLGWSVVVGRAKLGPRARGGDVVPLPGPRSRPGS